MKYVKNLSLIIFSFVLTISSPLYSLASEKLTEKKERAIIKNCDAITISLRAIQKTDSSSRVYLGSFYDAFLKNFLIPLNVRLLKDNNQNSNLTEIQSKFSELRTKFSSDFIDYSKSMDNLLNVNCEKSPADFYTKLKIVQVDRAKIDVSVEEMNNLISKTETIVETLKGNYGK